MSYFFELKLSSKGQVTLPVEVRRMLGLEKSGKTNLTLEMTDENTAVIRAPKTLEELHEYLAPKIEGIEPLENVHEFYQTRKPRV